MNNSESEAMDMGLAAGAAEIGGSEQGPASPGVALCITIADGKVSVEQYKAGGQPTGQSKAMSIGDALKAVLDAYEAGEAESGDGDFDSGFEGDVPTPRQKMPLAGMRMPS
jgi:hypothetical protein